MNTPARLSLYGLGLVAAFAAAFAISAAVVPTEVVQAHATATGSHGEGHGAATPDAGTPTALPGLSLSAGGYTLQPVAAPSAPGAPGALAFSITNDAGEALTHYETEHEQDLHLIVVRSDGAQFRHVHPTINAAGLWSIDWEWAAPGSYRVFADFTPGGSDAGLTLSRTVQVAGELAPAPVTPTERVATVAGFTVTLHGDLTVGAESTLTAEVAKDGVPVTAIEPYLGAFGHLVALRDGDLAYLHVHPTGADPKPGEVSGPGVSFATQAPTAGRYLLYFDFQVAGQTHSAMFVLTASAAEHTNEASEHPASAAGHTDQDTH